MLIFLAVASLYLLGGFGTLWVASYTWWESKNPESVKVCTVFWGWPVLILALVSWAIAKKMGIQVRPTSW
jgi:hypothetical protein